MNMLRALTFFDDAEREAALRERTPDDWATVKIYECASASC